MNYAIKSSVKSTFGVLLHPELSVVSATNQDCDLDSICEDVSVASVLNHSIILSDKSDTDNSLNSTQNVNDNSAFEPVNKRQKLLSDQSLSKSMTIETLSYDIYRLYLY
mgnify:CR=1 FL=1